MTPFNRKVPFKLSFLILPQLIGILLLPLTASAATVEQEMQVKKIVMMLNIVVREYAVGIVDGAISNAAEYEESLGFLELAGERYQSLTSAMPGPESEAVKAQLAELVKQSQNKTEASKIRSLAGAINDAVLKQFAIEMKPEPATPINLTNGKQIYESRCAICHGLAGKGDGAIASTLNPPAAILASPDITGDEETKPYDNYQVINVGIANTAMIAWADHLTETEIWDVTYYIRSFSNPGQTLPITTGSSGAAKTVTLAASVESTFQEINSLLDKSFTSYKNKQMTEAIEAAFDAYLVYEKVEGGLINKRKELGLGLEASFSRFRGEIKRGAALEHVESLYNGIKEDLELAQSVLEEKTGFTGLFLQSMAIIVREGFEAILIIAALIAFLVKSRNEDKLKAIYMGVGVGIAASVLTAYILKEVLQISMANQELMEGWIMLIAVAVLFWVSYWLISKIEATKWQSYITGKMRQAVSTGSLATLSTVAFLSVYREGFETVLFYKALYLYASDSTAGIIPGFLAGCAALGVVYYLISSLGMRISIKWFFSITSIFLAYMAFTFLGKGMHALQMGEQLSLTQANFLPSLGWMGIYPTWETFIAQSVLALTYVGALGYTLVIKPELDSKHLKAETNHIQKSLASVHAMVEHITHHAKRCEIFLKDTKDMDLMELSDHLKEIHGKVHELSDQILGMENQLLDEYDRLAQQGFGPREKKGLS